MRKQKQEEVKDQDALNASSSSTEAQEIEVTDAAPEVDPTAHFNDVAKAEIKGGGFGGDPVENEAEEPKVEGEV